MGRSQNITTDDLILERDLLVDMICHLKDNFNRNRKDNHRYETLSKELKEIDKELKERI